MTWTTHISAKHVGFHTLHSDLIAQDVDKPVMPLTSLVSMLWIYHGDGLPNRIERILPTGTVELVINLHGGMLYKPNGEHSQKSQSFQGAVVYGPHTKSFDFQTSQHSVLLGIHFKPGGAASFFPFPMGALQNQCVVLTDLWGSTVNDLVEQVATATTLQIALRLVEQVLFAHAVRPFVLHPAVRYALDLLQGEPPPPHIATIAKQIGLSLRHFGQLFYEQVGLTPKRFSRVRRFQSVLCHINTTQRVHWADVALACGYFDQAHFAHEFRVFSGLTPVQYLEHCTDQRNHVVLDM